MTAGRTGTAAVWDFGCDIEPRLVTNRDSASLGPYGNALNGRCNSQNGTREEKIFSTKGVHERTNKSDLHRPVLRRNAGR